MHRTTSSWIRSALALLLAVAIPLTLAACGSSDDDGGSTAAAAGSTAAQTTSTSASETAEVVYDGPEADLPKTFPEPVKRDGYSFTIGYPNPSRAVPTLAAQEDAVRAEVARLGGRVIATDAQFSVQKQVSDFEQLLSQRVDAIILSSLDPNSLTPLLEKARAQGVPVFVNDVPYRADLPFQDGFTAEILTGNDISAYNRAKLLADTQPGAKYGLIGVGIPAPMLDYIVRQVRYWGDRFGLEYVDRVDARLDTPEDGATAATALLAKQPDLDAIFTVSDSVGLGAATAVRTSANPDIKVIANGATASAIEGVRSGDLFATFAASPAELHRQLVWAAYNTLTRQNSDQPRQVVLDGGTIVTRENADTYAGAAG